MDTTKRKLLAIVASQVGEKSTALRALGYSASDLKAFGYSASDLKAAGYSASALKAAGYSASDLKAAGYSASALRALGYSASDLKAFGYSASDLAEWDEIPVLEKPYTKMLADINAGTRVHDQSTYGPDCDPKENLCGTPMCTAGHLVNQAGEVGYKLLRKYGSFAQVAGWIHAKSRPDVPPQNFGSIPQEWAMAYIEERAAEEANA